MFRRIARIAGKAPTSRPAAIINNKPRSQMPASTGAIGIAPPIAACTPPTTSIASARPSTPPSSNSSTDSASTIAQCIRDAAADLGLPVPTREQASHVIGLGLHYGTYTAEVYRAGIDNVPLVRPPAARWYLPWRYGRWRGTNDAINPAPP